jgi:hypothetical protein
MNMKVLSIRQPWAWLIVNGHKPIENRTWNTTYRGPLLIHAALRITPEERAAWEKYSRLGIPSQLDVSGIVGSVELIDVVREHDSPWFTGPYGWLLVKPLTLPYYAMAGRLGLFEPPEDILAEPLKRSEPRLQIHRGGPRRPHVV